MRFRHALALFFAAAALLGLEACAVQTPTLSNIRDSRLFDRRINETPRQKTMRECQQESDRFRTSCTFCHTTDKAEAIHAPAQLQLTESGQRARIMRTSPTFGLNTDCATCHQSKFKLNRNAEKQFGPGGTKRSEAQKVLNP